MRWGTFCKSRPQGGSRSAIAVAIYAGLQHGPPYPHPSNDFAAMKPLVLPYRSPISFSRRPLSYNSTMLMLFNSAILAMT